MNKRPKNSSPHRLQHLSLYAIRDILRRSARQGITCPCCDRLVKVYRRKIHAEMVLWLIGLYRLCKDNAGYYTTLDILKNSRHLRAGGTNGTLLVHWGLIEKIPEENKAGAPSGSYRITPLGKKFIEGVSTTWKWVDLLNGACYAFSAESIDVHQALGSKFDYNELMKGFK